MRSARKGLTVMETVLALGILSITLLGLLTVFISGLKVSQASAEITGATHVGREFMELVKARGYAATAPGTFDGRVPDTSDSATGFPFAPYPATRVDNQEYKLKVTCTDFTPTIRDVRLEVYWDVERDAKLTFFNRVHI